MHEICLQLSSYWLFDPDRGEQFEADHDFYSKNDLVEIQISRCTLIFEIC